MTDDYNPHLEGRLLTLFVSSTFKDMQAERDCIKDYVAPELQARLRPYGAAVRFVDLRWGVVTDSDSTEAKREDAILKVCFNQIARSRPLFVGLLGGRYGWVPPQQRVESLDVSVRQLLGAEEMSVTEMEIRYGALANKEINKHAVFCLRSNPDDESIDVSIYGERDPSSRQKLEALRSKVRRSVSTDRLIDYSPSWRNGHIVDLGDFAGKLTEILWREACEMLHLDGQPLPSPTQEREADLSLFMQYTSRVFAGYANEINFLQVSLAAGKRLAIVGPHGCGKSSMLAQVSHLLGQKKDLFPLYYDVLASVEMSSATVMLSHLCTLCARRLGESFDEIAERVGWVRLLGQYEVFERSLIDLEESLATFCHRLFEKGIRPIILIDNVDALATPRYLSQWLWLPSRVAALVTLSNQSTPIPSGIECFDLGHMSMSDAGRMLERHVAYYGKQFFPTVAQVAIARSVTPAGGCNVMWLSMLEYYLLNFDADDFATMLTIEAPDEERRIEYYSLRLATTLPTDVPEAFEYVIKKMHHVFGAEVVEQGLSLLALGRQGFRDDDFERITNGCWDALSFAQFCRCMHPFISEHFRRHQWMLRYPWLGQHWSNKMSPEELKEQHARIASMLLGLPLDDPLRIQEAFYHALAAEDYAQCAALIADTDARHAMPIIRQLTTMEEMDLSYILTNIVVDCEIQLRPVVIGHLFLFVIKEWVIEHQQQSDILLTDWLRHINLDTLSDSYHFTCLSEVVKDRMLYAKKAKKWEDMEKMALWLYRLSQRWNDVEPARGNSGLMVACMELFAYYSQTGQTNEAMKYLSF